MAISTTAALVGSAAIGAAGSAYSASKQSSAAKKAAKAAQFNPYGITGPGGTTRFEGNQAFAEFSPEQQAMFNQLGGFAQNQLGGGPFGGMLAGFQQMGGGAMPGAFQNSQWAAGQLPTNATHRFLGGTFGREQMMNQLGSGFLSQAAGQQFQTDPWAQQALSQGFGAFNTPDAPSFEQTFQDRLGLLREQAQPFEQQQVMGELNSQFGRGIKEATPGLERQKSLAQGLAQADTSRQLDAMGFSQGLRQMEQGNVLNQRQLGLGLTGQGFNAQNQGFDNQLRQQGLYGQLGMGLMGQGQQFGQAGYGARLGLNELQNSRAMQMLGTAQNMFGFGQQGQLANQQMGMGMFGAQQGMHQGLLNQLQMGGNFGAAGANAGANQGNFMMGGAQNNFGDFMAGLGGGMLNAGMQNWGKSGPAIGGGMTTGQGMANHGGYMLGGPGIPQGFTNHALFPNLFGE